MTRRYGRQEYEIIDDLTAYITLTKGYKAIVDLEDAYRVSEFPWIANIPSNGYVRAMRIVNRKSLFLHHFILRISSEIEVDHIDRDPLNYRKKNLREISHKENMLNTDRHDNRLGVSYNKRADLWMAYLDMPNKKRKHLGYRKTKEAALDLVEEVRCLL